jgi:hypothetical protein
MFYKSFSLKYNIKQGLNIMARREFNQDYYREQQEKVNRIRQMFTTTTAGAAAVAVVFVLNPFSERARIEELKGFEDSIYYHVYVNEAVNFTPGSVALVFETEEEVFRIPLDPGVTFGILEGVTPITGYPARIEGSEGFGVSTIVSSGIYTKNEPDFEMYDPSLNSGEKDSSLIYSFQTYYQDLNNEVENLKFSYGYAPLLTGEYVELSSQDITLEQAIEINGIPNQNVLVKSKVTADVTKKDAEGRSFVENTVLDEDEFYTPLFHESSFEIIRVIDSVIEYEVIPDYRYLKDVNYKVTIFENGRELESKTVSSSNTKPEHLLRFERLFPETTYQLRHEMIFLDHRTNRINTLLIAENEITTLEKFDFITSIADQENRYLITVVVEDVNNLFGSIYYEIRNGDAIESSNTIPLRNADADTKFGEFSIRKTEVNNRTLIFGVVMTDTNNTRYEIRKLRR